MRKFVASALVVMLSAAGVAACGGDDDGGNADSTENQDDGGNADSGGSEDTTDTTEDSSDGDDSSGGTGDAALDELLARSQDAVIKITYDMDGEEMTIAQDGARRAIYSDNSVIITMEDGTTVSCDSLDSDPSCIELPEGLGDLAALGSFGFFTMIFEGLVEGADEVSGLEQESDEIAGRDAVCVDWDASALLGGLGDLGDLGDLGEDIDTDASARICVDEETGFLLEMSSEGDGTTSSIIATDVGEPSDEDFEPPAEVEPNPLDELGDLDLDELMDQGQ